MRTFYTNENTHNNYYKLINIDGVRLNKCGYHDSGKLVKVNMD